ncbi:MAG: hypothetical protein NT077_03430 [Candidatus Taylorbacteria bacterium]|nr:hypothetical protein [Candidatus Taylorbacteria bacterium]
MNQLTPEQIQEKFNKLPKELQNVLSSAEIHDKIRSIGTAEGLMIDQIGELVDQVGMIILGIAKASDFVEDTSARLSINSEKARRIAEKINTEVFQAIKTSLTAEEKLPAETEMEVESSLSSLERAGDFTIEREPMKEAALEDKNPVSEKDRSKLIANLENPTPVKPRMATSGAAFTEEIRDESTNEPLVEQLLHGSTAIPEEKVVRQPEIPKPSQPGKQELKKPVSNDPYREPVI